MTIQGLCTCVWVQNMDCKMGALEEVNTSWLLECGVGVQDCQLEDETNSLPIHIGHPSHLWIASVSKQEDRGEAEIFILSTAGRATLDGASQSCSPMSDKSTLRHPLKGLLAALLPGTDSFREKWWGKFYSSKEPFWTREILSSAAQSVCSYITNAK